jgi:Domain of unknown function (DUF4157)
VTRTHVPLRRGLAGDRAETDAVRFAASGLLARGRTPATGPALGARERKMIERALRAPAVSLAGPERRRFEALLRTDLTGVRLHTDEVAGASARVIGANAYAVGSHIVFAPGRYQPTSATGQRLVAHELAHVVQNRALGVPLLLRQAEGTDADTRISLGALDNLLVAGAAGQALGEPQFTLLREFLRGAVGGVLTVSPEQLQRLQDKLGDLGLGGTWDFARGFAIGVATGLWDSLTGLFEGIVGLVRLPRAVLEALTTTLPELASKYGPKLRELIDSSAAMTQRLQSLLQRLLRDPAGSIAQLEPLLKTFRDAALAQVRAYGHAAASKLLAFVSEPWEQFGRDIGHVVGQVVFEVLLAVATDVVGNLVKESAQLVARLAARAVTTMTDTLRTFGRLLTQAAEWLGTTARRLAGEIGDLFRELRELLLKALPELDRLGLELETARTAVRIPVSDLEKAPAFESRAVRQGGRAQPKVEDLRPPKVHPSKADEASTRGRKPVAEKPPSTPETRGSPSLVLSADEQHVQKLRQGYPKLADANLRLRGIDPSQPGYKYQEMVTGSRTELVADWPKRRRTIRIDGIDEERGFLLDAKERASGRQYRHAEPLHEEPPGPDVVEHFEQVTGHARPRTRGRPVQIPRKDLIQLADQVDFAREHGLRGVEWITSDSRYEEMFKQVVDENGWTGFVHIQGP